MKFLCMIALAGVLASASGLSQGERMRDIVTAVLTVGKLGLLNEESTKLTDIAPRNFSGYHFRGLFSATNQKIGGLSGVTTKVEAVPNSKKINVFINFPYLTYDCEFSLDGLRPEGYRNLSAKASILIENFSIRLTNLLIGETAKNGVKAMQIQSTNLDLDYSYLNADVSGPLPEGEPANMEIDIYAEIREMTRDAGTREHLIILNKINKMLAEQTGWLRKQVPLTRPISWAV